MHPGVDHGIFPLLEFCLLDFGIVMSCPSSVFDQLLAVALSRHLYYKESGKKALLTRIVIPKAEMGFLDLGLLLVSLIFWHVNAFNGLSA